MQVRVGVDLEDLRFEPETIEAKEGSMGAAGASWKWWVVDITLQLAKVKAVAGG